MSTLTAYETLRAALVLSAHWGNLDAAQYAKDAAKLALETLDKLVAPGPDQPDPENESSSQRQLVLEYVGRGKRELNLLAQVKANAAEMDRRMMALCLECVDQAGKDGADAERQAVLRLLQWRQEQYRVDGREQIADAVLQITAHIKDGKHRR
jgi:hypothetical protein